MTIIDFLYEEYCRARLAEMRKQLLLRSPQNDKLSDAGSEDRKSLSDDTTAEHREGQQH
jgi:hypothetical protein